MIVDPFGRRIDYMRISVTDRCNLRCRYCMPAEGTDWYPRRKILSYEQIEAVIRMAVRLGIRRFRFTGGEPLVRRDFVPFLARVNRMEGVESLALTTNGLLLAQFAEELKDAGVERVNLSIDSFRRETFRQLTRRDALAKVLEGLDAVTRLGFETIKLNCVLVRGVNDGEIPDFLGLTMRHPYHVRFIEFMPSGDWEGNTGSVVPAAEVIAAMEEQGFLPDRGPGGNGPARYWRFPGAPGTAGVISPVSAKFCESCNRVRLNAKGELRGCLLDEGMVSLKSALDAENDEEVKNLFLRVIAEKPEKHYDLRTFHMSTIGG